MCEEKKGVKKEGRQERGQRVASFAQIIENVLLKKYLSHLKCEVRDPTVNCFGDFFNESMTRVGTRCFVPRKEEVALRATLRQVMDICSRRNRAFSSSTNRCRYPLVSGGGLFP